MPDPVPFALPNGTTIQVCDDCARQWPQHNYFCAAVASFTREQILREMLALEDRMATLSSITEWCAKLPEGDGALAAIELRQQFSLRRLKFWGWADRLLGERWTDATAIRAMRDELRALRKSQQEKQDRPQATPPWKRRTHAA